MCAITAISLFAFFLSWLLWPGPSAPNTPPVVTVLCYHTFDSPKKTPYTVSSARFREEMRFLAIQHIPVIPLPLFAAYLNGARVAIPARAVIITIDDGYKSAASVAWPIVRHYGFPFTLFIYSGAISRHPSALTWSEVRAMAAAGVDIESHTLSHPLLTHPGRLMTRPEYTAWLDEQLRAPKKVIEAQLHLPVTALAYPYGGYSEYVIERVKQAGYTAAFTCDDADATRGTDPLVINRRLVFRQTSLREYARYFGQKPLRVAERSPRDGERLKRIPTEVRGRLLDLDTLRLDTVKMLVDKTGRRWVAPRIDPKSGEFHLSLPATDKRGFFFVTLTAKDRLDDRLVHEASWMYIVSKNASRN